jgi:hypothetical protein
MPHHPLKSEVRPSTTRFLHAVRRASSSASAAKQHAAHVASVSTPDTIVANFTARSMGSTVCHCIVLGFHCTGRLQYAVCQRSCACGTVRSQQPIRVLLCVHPCGSIEGWQMSAFVSAAHVKGLVCFGCLPQMRGLDAMLCLFAVE